MNSKWFAPLIIVAMLIFSAAVYNSLPDQIPIHWNVDGNADRYGYKIFGVLALPIVSAVIMVMIPGLRILDPLRDSYEKFEETYRFIINILVAFFGLVHVVSLGIALGWDIEISKVIGVGLGILFALFGNVIVRVRPNWFMGFRTPWTLADPEVWRVTHRMGGRLMFVAGLTIIILSEHGCLGS
jgi:uncharacterized membrane protein